MHTRERSQGAYAQLDVLTGFHLPAKHLTLRQNTSALAHLAGPYKTKIRGRGMEFEDVRQYQAGDDVRTIDWRVTARTGVAHTKQFREEREKPVLVVLDQRQSMFFGSQIAMKSVLAADIAAYIAWAALQKGDRIGGLIFNDSEHREVRPRSQRKAVLQLLHHIVAFNNRLEGHATTPQRRMRDALLEVKRVAKPGTQVYVISDFSDLVDDDSALLYDLARHCDLIGVQVYDKLEAELPRTGVFHGRHGKVRVRFDSSDKTTRAKYAADFEAHRAALNGVFGKFRVPLVPVGTHQNPLPVLQTYFGQRVR